MQHRSIGIEALQNALVKAWSIDSSTKWTPENPARGQCGVTALVVQDFLGGEILKTDTFGACHFYNQIDGVRRDFTASQFPQPIVYHDVLSNRAEACADTSATQYLHLKERVETYIRSGR